MKATGLKSAGLTGNDVKGFSLGQSRFDDVPVGGSTIMDNDAVDDTMLFSDTWLIGG
jgi:hypothetical protein